MEDNKDSQEYLDILKAELEKFQNVEYADWDSIVLHLGLGEKSVVKIKVMRQDMEAMKSLHSQSRSEMLELMIQTLEAEVANKK